MFVPLILNDLIKAFMWSRDEIKLDPNVVFRKKKNNPKHFILCDPFHFIEQPIWTIKCSFGQDLLDFNIFLMAKASLTLRFKAIWFDFMVSFNA